MDSWSVEVTGENSELELITKKLNSSNLSVIKQGDVYYLKSSDFEGITDHEEVRLIASQIIEKLNMILKADQGFSSLEVKEIINENNGKKSFSNTADLKTIVRIRDLLRLCVDYENLMELMENDNKVYDTFIFYYLETNWVNLYKVYETIESDIDFNNIIKNGWACRNEIKLFTCTAHNRKAAGYLARHATDRKMDQKCEDLINKQGPMKLNEGQRLIKRILNSWLITKIEPPIGNNRIHL